MTYLSQSLHDVLRVRVLQVDVSFVLVFFVKCIYIYHIFKHDTLDREMCFFRK
jgi:hypothetical protein